MLKIEADWAGTAEAGSQLKAKLTTVYFSIRVFFLEKRLCTFLLNFFLYNSSMKRIFISLLIIIINME
jgi:hypothetical protein